MTLEGYPAPPPRPALTDEELQELMWKYNTDCIERIAAAGGLITPPEK